MTMHLSARLAWHMDGWNGHICRNPAANTYCVGRHSYPGTMIAEQRNLEFETTNAGRDCATLDTQDYLPPCMYAVNAFGDKEITAYAKPPDFFRDASLTRYWPLPPATVCVWPYEVMYGEDVEQEGGAYDYWKRLENAKEYFKLFEVDRSLIFYYANYSNPFSENDTRRYVVVGIGRLKVLGQIQYYENSSERVKQKYGGGFVWQMNVTSHYPDQGLRLPYHLYLDRPDVLERILFVPENPRDFKFGTRQLSDDAALGLVERLGEIVGVLQDIDDKSENWPVRQAWLASLMAELWRNRGLYPGILRVWEYLKFSEAIPFTMQQIPARGEQVIKDELFAFVEGRRKSVKDLPLDEKRVKAIQKRWAKLEPAQQALLRDTLPQFDLRTQQIENLLDHPTEVSVLAGHSEIAENPYLLSEQYVGFDPDDQITFRQIDHGIFPSPELGAQHEIEIDDWRRLRALCVDQLRQAQQHTFLPADQVLGGLNHRLRFLPDWKRAQFRPRDLEVEHEELSGALTYRRDGDRLYLYRKSVFEDERLVEKTLRDLSARPDITLRFPVKEENWKTFLYDSDSEIARTHPAEYEQAMAQQIQVCQQIFRRPVSILCGAAGTGKTTVVEAIIKAIEKGHGTGTSFQLLAPTGKAADRLRERTHKEASTIHSFLNRLGWLNDNLTFRPYGQREENTSTLIIDESSMLDLPLLATLFRAINWQSVQRLIFVGDPNQLPPIGIGKVFADLIDWMKSESPNSVGELTTNMRQIRNRLTGKGTGIIDLASIYIRRELADQKSADLDAQEEEILARVQEGGDIAGDLRILYWQTTDELETLLIRTIVADMERDTSLKLDPQKPYLLWDAAMTRQPEKSQYPEAMQIISPYRGELFGIEHINLILQKHKNGWWVDNKGTLGGVTYFDKVIQIMNRSKSRPLKAWNAEKRQVERVEVFNGEIGMTKIHAFDKDKWRWNGFRVQQFQVTFSRRQNLWVQYMSQSEVEENLELAYAISVHKAQGSEFQRVYLVLPKHKRGLLSRELFYTGITRAQTHCTILVQEDIAPILSLRRPENSHLARINSSLFQFRPAAHEFQTMYEWYEEGKIHRTLANQMVRSKSEVIIANMLVERDIPFEYEVPLKAADGTFYLPDFTLKLRGETWYWEHLGMLHDQRYRSHWEVKKGWYEKHGFAERLILTQEKGGFDSQDVARVLNDHFGV